MEEVVVGVCGFKVEVGFEVAPSFEEALNAWELWGGHAAVGFLSPLQDLGTILFSNSKICIYYVSPVIIEFVRSISFYPRDLQGFKEIPGIYEVKS